MGVRGFPAGEAGQRERGWEFSSGTAGHGTAAPCPRAGRGCTRCSHRASPAPARPQETEARGGGTEGLPERALALGQAGQRAPRHSWAPLAPFPLPDVAGQAPDTCWAQLPGLDTPLKDNTCAEFISSPPAGEDPLRFMAQQRKTIKIQTRGQP